VATSPCCAVSTAADDGGVDGVDGVDGDADDGGVDGVDGDADWWCRWWCFQ